MQELKYGSHWLEIQADSYHWWKIVSASKCHDCHTEESCEIKFKGKCIILLAAFVCRSQVISEAVNPNVETLIVKESTVTTDIPSGSRWMRAVEDVIVILVSFHFSFFSSRIFMSQKAEKPSLSGTRLKTRKRGKFNVCCIYFCPGKTPFFLSLFYP